MRVFISKCENGDKEYFDLNHSSILLWRYLWNYDFTEPDEVYRIRRHIPRLVNLIVKICIRFKRLRNNQKFEEYAGHYHTIIQCIQTACNKNQEIREDVGIQGILSNYVSNQKCGGFS